MLDYVLIGLCLSLVGVAGLQLTYMFYLDRIDRERRKRIVQLEHRCSELSARLASARTRIEQQNEMIEKFEAVPHQSDEVWADVLDE
ncbi:MAG: hypothetical protein IT174_13425 [Acidobacteria bacterium]|nr:hypothetical protein [Acidobacteriota bacterium]